MPAKAPRSRKIGHEPIDRSIRSPTRTPTMIGMASTNPISEKRAKYEAARPIWLAGSRLSKGAGSIAARRLMVPHARGSPLRCRARNGPRPGRRAARVARRIAGDEHEDVLALVDRVDHPTGARGIPAAVKLACECDAGFGIVEDEGRNRVSVSRAARDGWVRRHRDVRR